MKKLNILIAAGPTREYIDPVRYLSNDSSGKMGFALAKAACRLGLHVTLVAGPVALETPRGVKRIDVISALDMRAAVLAKAPKAGIIIMCAAVADYRPARFSRMKIKRTIEPSNHRTIELVSNPDILAELGRKKKRHQTLVGFALETNNLERNARAKLEEKNCDWIVANSANAIGAKVGSAILFSRKGRRIPIRSLPKDRLAAVILSHVVE